MADPLTLPSGQQNTANQRPESSPEIWIEDSSEGQAPTVARAEVAALQEEVRQLHQALSSRAAIDQAMGIVMALGRLTADQAWDVLREVSQRTNIKMRQLAHEITSWAHTGELHLSIRVALEQAVRARDSRVDSRARPGLLG
ncbi:ANTAR domain-containing protein [Streptomyces sp. NPDC008141]|uniref:ANTAR domain-containing protein n=1 Tax=Streptomyces sp. NPDC008141 TaxID=3364815 RepID=UPI0036E60ECA